MNKRTRFLLVTLGLLLTHPLFAKPRQVFVYNNHHIPSTIDPALAHGMYERQVLNQLFEGLTTQNPRDLTSEPGVALKWTISPDGKVYTFTLNRNAKWSDGEAVTADDFVYSWLRVLDPRTESKYANQLFYLKNARAYNKGEISDPNRVGIKAIDKQTLEVVLENPASFFLELTSFYTLFPVPSHKLKKSGSSWTQTLPLVSNGPFMLESRQEAKPGEPLWVLKKNPNYWNKATVNLEEIRIYGISEAEKALRMYAEGKLDYTGETPIPAKELAKWRYTSDYKSVPWFAVNFLRLNTTRAPFNDQRVRQAISEAIDRSMITTYLVPGGHQPALSMVPPGIRDYEPARLNAFNIDRAQRLLSEAGYCAGNAKPAPGGCKAFPKIKMILDRNDADIKLVLGIQQMLEKNLGIKGLQIKIIDNWGDYLKAVDAMDFDLAKSRWTGDYFDPNTFLELWVTNNMHNDTGWSNPKYDELLAKAGKELNAKKRLLHFQKAEELLLAEMPIVPVFDYAKTYLLKPYVKNYVDNLRSVLFLRNVFIQHYDLNPQP